ncbi:disease resistance protein RPM1 [Vigna unguiculata]|uniref:Disease resistance protein RPM1 n=1 Tax=Vigna unguiculata TaxID=3917 RepID=A0A4D6MR80_VIGUN|nr:disease resistance protein RPM1 [Vigna unguiculata]
MRSRLKERKTAVVGGALLSAFIDVLFDRLASPEFVNYIRGKKPDKLLQKMKSQLLVVKVVLADAEKRQITDSNVKEWLDLLNDLVYEVDDLLDEVSTKVATKKEVSNPFSHLFKRNKVVSISKLEDIVGRLDEILKQKESLDLREIPVENNQSWKAQTTSLEDREFYFRADELGKETKIDRKTRHLSFKRFSDSVLDTEVLDKLALPDSIGELIHLRYLNLSGTSIATLPDSLCNLNNLQTLMLSSCLNLTKLPSAMQNLVNLRHLEIIGTPIKEMPKRMGKLNQLQNLDIYIVGKHVENSIKELGGIPNLHGYFCIKNLENVTKGEEALEARIMEKKHINTLRLEWSACNDNCTEFQIELDVLSNLQPHQDLKWLSIRGYKGTRFPEWIGNFSYQNMTNLSLRNCKSCCKLPSLGQLPSLKKLEISDMNSVKTIDAGFYKKEDCSSMIPFPSLESLHIYDMPCWEEWSGFDSKAFPVLKVLYIFSCPKLKGDLPNHLPALGKLRITNCELLVSSVPRAPTLQVLQILESNKLAFDVFPLMVESIEIKGRPMVESVMETITNIQPTSLRYLALEDCSSAISFPGDRLPASLKNLQISGLKKLKFPMQQKHELLESLRMNNSCDSLTSLPLATFPNLIRLRITNCENMESLSVLGSESFKNLSSFVINGCPNFVSFPGEGLCAPNLTRFSVYDCAKLKSLPYQMRTLLPKMEYLNISNCQQIEWFPGGGMPPNLRTLDLRNCEKLLSGLEWMDMVTSLNVHGPCDAINSFPKEGLLPPSLTSLSLIDLSSLKTLECKGLLHLSSLQQLQIQNCKKLENIAGERLPVSLLKLSIGGCPLLQKLCHKKDRQIWPKICHVRGIKIDGRWI